MVLSVAFWISLALSLLKLLEIVLSTEQERRIQGWLETVTLRLSYVNVSYMYAALRKTRVQIFLAIVTMILAYAWTAVEIIAHGGSFGHFLGTMLRTHLGWMAFQIALILISFPLGMRWLFRSQEIASFAKKVGLILGTYVIIILISVFGDVDIFFDSYRKIRLFIFLPFIVPVSVCFYAALYVLAIKFTQGLLWFSTKLLWRVVEYPKGAWAAVLFLSTAVLGVAQALVVSRH